MILKRYSLFGNMKKTLFLPAVFIFAGVYFAKAQNAVTHSAVTFKTKNLGIGVDGSVSGLEATVHFNPNDLANSSITASVDVKTLTTDNSMRDNDLKSDEFFDVPHYPKITLKSISITHKSGNRYTGQFSLTIKTKTKTIELPFTCTPKGDVSDFNGRFKINRLDYGVGSSSLTLSNEVDISIDAEIKN